MPERRLAELDPGALPLEVADGMIENVVGEYALPFAVAVNFVVDGIEVLVPMAVEEPSIVAAAGNAARLARPGGFQTRCSAPVMIGQIQVTNCADVDVGAASVRGAAESILADARRLVPRLAERGGGPVGLDVRVLARPRDPTAACSSSTCTSTAATRWARTSSTRCARRSPTASRGSPAGAPVCAS
jgi:hydroxymethylglutaryl-CoA reductase